jgi:hypothetical protein
VARALGPGGSTNANPGREPKSREKNQKTKTKKRRVASSFVSLVCIVRHHTLRVVVVVVVVFTFSSS